MKKSKIDWFEFQKYYDESLLSINEVCEIFCISTSSVSLATKRKEFIPRNKSECQISNKYHPKTEIDQNRIQDLIEKYNKGSSFNELISMGFKYSECYYARKNNLLKSRTLSEASKLSLKKFGPRKHSEEFKQKLSIEQSLRNRGGKCKWYDVNGIKVQGTWELNFALLLNENNIEWQKPKTNTDIFSYLKNGKLKSYSPDFYIPQYNCFIEIKGYWWGDDKEKMNIILKSYPKEKFIIIEKDLYYKLIKKEIFVQDILKQL